MNSDFNNFSNLKELTTVGDLRGILERFPDDWPIVYQIIETENINSIAAGLRKTISIEQITIVLNILEKYKQLWIDQNFICSLIKKISGENNE